MHTVLWRIMEINQIKLLGLMKQYLTILAHVVLVVNTLLAIVFCLYLILYEVDFFLVLWLGSVVGLVSCPLGLILLILAWVRRWDQRIPITVWSLSIVAVILLSMYVLPPATKRIPYAMERHYLKYSEQIRQLSDYALDSLQLPDSTSIVLSKDTFITRHVLGKHPMHDFENVFFMYNDTVFDVDEERLMEARRLLAKCGLKECTVYSHYQLVEFEFAHKGFGTWWFRVPRQPLTEEEIELQKEDYHLCPCSAEVYFIFDGGAIDHDCPFPYKEDFINRKP